MFLCIITIMGELPLSEYKRTAKCKPILRILYLQALLVCIFLGLFSCKKADPTDPSGVSSGTAGVVAGSDSSSDAAKHTLPETKGSNITPPTTEKPTEPSTTEKPTEPPTTEKPTEPPTTEKPTEPPTTEKPTEPPTTEKPTEPPTTAAPIQVRPEGTLRAYVQKYREQPLTTYEAELKIRKEGLRSILSGMLSEGALNTVLGFLDDDSAGIRMTGKLPDPSVSKNNRVISGTVSMQIKRFGLSTNLELFRWEFRGNRFASLDYSGLMRLLSLAFLGDEKRDTFLKEKFGEAILPYLEKPYEVKADLFADPFENTLTAAKEIWNSEEYFLLEILDKTRYPARSFSDGELTVLLNTDTLYLFVESFAMWAVEEDMYRLAENRIRMDEALATDIAVWEQADELGLLTQLWGPYVQTDEKQDVKKTGRAWAAALKEAKQEVSSDPAAARAAFTAYAAQMELPEFEIDFYSGRIEARSSFSLGSLRLILQR